MPCDSFFFVGMRLHAAVPPRAQNCRKSIIGRWDEIPSGHDDEKGSRHSGKRWGAQQIRALSAHFSFYYSRDSAVARPLGRIAFFLTKRRARYPPQRKTKETRQINPRQNSINPCRHYFSGRTLRLAPTPLLLRARHTTAPTLAMHHCRHRLRAPSLLCASIECQRNRPCGCSADRTGVS